MRGKPSGEAKAVVKYGITPAHAGKTEFRHEPAAKCEDHPRACGENSD